MAAGLYELRRGPQTAALILLSAVVAVAAGLAARRFSDSAGASLAACGVLLSLAVWCVDVISLHAADAVFNASFHGIRLANLIWCVGSLLTAAGILIDALTADRSCRAAIGADSPPV